VREFREQRGFTAGVIIRTAASGRSKEDIPRGTWSRSTRHGSTSARTWTRNGRPPWCTESRVSSASCCATLLTDEFQTIRIDNEQEYNRVLELVRRIMPNLAPRVKAVHEPYPIFEEYGVQTENRERAQEQVWLKSGGSIVIIRPKRSLAIDVNTGRYVGKKSSGRLEDTIVKTNLEAAKEIVRQLRLRDLGGNRRGLPTSSTWRRRRTGRRCFRASSRSFGRIGRRPRRFQVSDFGLRDHHAETGQAKPRTHAHGAVSLLLGSGVIKSSSTICYEILNEVRRSAPISTATGLCCG